MIYWYISIYNLSKFFPSKIAHIQMRYKFTYLKVFNNREEKQKARSRVVCR